MEYQTSYGRRIWSRRGNLFVVCGKLWRWSRRSCSFAAARFGCLSGFSSDGSGLWRGWDEGFGGGVWLYISRCAKTQSKNPWNYDKQLYEQRNQLERIFRRIKRFRRIFTRYDKLDVIFLPFVHFALMFDALMWTDPRIPQNSSIGAWARRLPGRDMLWQMCFSSILFLKAWPVYCAPRSLRTKSLSTENCRNALSTVYRTKAVLLFGPQKKKRYSAHIDPEQRSIMLCVRSHIWNQLCLSAIFRFDGKL